GASVVLLALALSCGVLACRKRAHVVGGDDAAASAPPRGSGSDVVRAGPRGVAPGEGDASPAHAHASDVTATPDASAAPQRPSFAFDCGSTPSAPKAGKSVGHTSVVYRLELSDGTRAAWKPNARRVEGRYKGEI